MAALANLNITNINVNVEPASAPSTLQRTGAAISVGSTNITPGTAATLTQESDLTPLLQHVGPQVASATWASGTATIVASAEIGLVVGEDVTLSGFVPTAWNGVFNIQTLTSSGGIPTLTLAMPTTPGTATTLGGLITGDTPELVEMVSSFYGQGSGLTVEVLELGQLSPIAAIAALNTYIQANLNTIYSFLLPREWTNATNAATLEAFLLNYNAPSAKIYFYGTATAAEAAAFPMTLKCLRLMIESPVIAAGEFSMASVFFSELNQNPSATNQRTPAAYTFLNDVTAYPTKGNGPTLLGLLNANLNYVGTGAEANISNTILRNGTGMDGNGFQVWYTIDWVQIQADISNTAAVFNGSNNPEAPLDYDQPGINTLLANFQQVISNGVAFGMINPNAPISVSAVPFATYVAQNPDDYPAGIYRGLSASFTPLNGFISVTINLTVFLTA
jgi:hypothetical protein